MKFNKSFSLKNTLWIYLTAFSILILFFLWFFQIIFLDEYYESYKTKEIKAAALKIKFKYDKNKDLTETFEEILYERGICIDVLNNDTLLTYNNNMNKSCIPNKSVEKYKDAIDKNDKKDILLKSDIKQYNRKILIYGFMTNDNTYFFLTTSIEPIDSTVTILQNQFLIVSLVILALSFLVGLFISRKLSKPIVNLNKSAKEFAIGNYNTTFESNSNISEIQELTNTLNYAKDELSKTDQLRRELLANVSHDLKTPLTMIKAYAEMVRDISYKDKIKREENLQIIIDEVDRLNLLVGDILDLSVMQANIYDRNIEEFDLVSLIKTVITRYKIFSLTEEYQFIFDCKLDKIMIKADKKKMEQVIYNLINNAINYTGNDKKVTIKIIDNINYYKVEIIDTGKGIKEEDLPFIWDKYYKSDKKHKRNMIGTGLGLSIVKNVLELHHYKYGVETKKNKGSTFYFEIEKETN